MQKKTINRDEEDISFISEVLRSTLLIQKLIKDNVSELCIDKVLYFMSYYIDVKKYMKGQVIFKQGDKGDKFYVIIKGKIDILILNEGVNIKQNFQNYLQYLIGLRKNNDNYILKKTLNANHSIFNIKIDDIGKIINDVFMMKIKNILVAKPKLEEIEGIYNDLSIEKTEFVVKFFKMIKEIEEEHNRNYIQTQNFQNNEKNKSEDFRNSTIVDGRRSSKLVTLLNSSNTNLGSIQTTENANQIIEAENHRKSDRMHTQSIGSNRNSLLSSGNLKQIASSNKLNEIKEDTSINLLKNSPNSKII